MKLTKEQQKIRDRLGPQWRRKLDAVLCTMADAGGMFGISNGQHKSDELCVAILRVLRAS